MSGQPVVYPTLDPGQISRQNELLAAVPNWEVLPLENYGNGRGVRYGLCVRFVSASGEVLLSNALHEACHDLRDAESPAPLGDVSTKLLLRIAVC